VLSGVKNSYFGSQHTLAARLNRQTTEWGKDYRIATAQCATFAE